MNYVFFDIECANCYQGLGKICSFGYVITDEGFNILEQHDMVINPDSKFNLGPDIKLAYTKSEFKHAPLFPMFYDEIDALLTDPDSLIFGFSVGNDVRYVRDDCKRYDLPAIDYRFYDVQQMYMSYMQIKNQPSLIGICNQYGIDETQEIHKSDDDARMTMEALKRLCELTDKTVGELIADYPRCVGEVNDGAISWVYAPVKVTNVVTSKSKRSRRRSGNGMSRYSPNYKFFHKYIADLTICENVSSPLNGLTVCISANYEEKHFRQMVYIADKLSELGAAYTSTASKADVFVTFDVTKADGTQKNCPRYAKIKQLIENGKDIRVISFNDLVEIAEIDREELDSFRVVNVVDEPKNIDEVDLDLVENNVEAV